MPPPARSRPAKPDCSGVRATDEGQLAPALCDASRIGYDDHNGRGDRVRTPRRAGAKTRPSGACTMANPIPARRRRRWWKALLFLTLLLLAAVAAFPWLLGTPAARRRLLTRANQTLAPGGL